MGVWWSNTAGTARRCFEEFAEIGVYENEVVDLGWGQLRRSWVTGAVRREMLSWRQRAIEGIQTTEAGVEAVEECYP